MLLNSVKVELTKRYYNISIDLLSARLKFYETKALVSLKSHDTDVYSVKPGYYIGLQRTNFIFSFNVLYKYVFIIFCVIAGCFHYNNIFDRFPGFYDWCYDGR